MYACSQHHVIIATLRQEQLWCCGRSSIALTWVLFYNTHLVHSLHTVTVPLQVLNWNHCKSTSHWLVQPFMHMTKSQCDCVMSRRVLCSLTEQEFMHMTTKSVWLCDVKTCPLQCDWARSGGCHWSTDQQKAQQETDWAARHQEAGHIWGHSQTAPQCDRTIQGCCSERERAKVTQVEKGGLKATERIAVRLSLSQSLRKWLSYSRRKQWIGCPTAHSFANESSILCFTDCLALVLSFDCEWHSHLPYCKHSCVSGCVL